MYIDPRFPLNHCTIYLIIQLNRAIYFKLSCISKSSIFTLSISASPFEVLSLCSRKTHHQKKILDFSIYLLIPAWEPIFSINTSQDEISLRKLYSPEDNYIKPKKFLKFLTRKRSSNGPISYVWYSQSDRREILEHRGLHDLKPWI